jgi:hypothetical protein
MSLVSVVCCQVEVSATSWSLVQRSPIECGVSKSVIVKPRKMRRPRPPRGCRAIEDKTSSSVVIKLSPSKSPSIVIFHHGPHVSFAKTTSR